MKKTMIGISIFVIVLLLLQITSMAAGSIAPSPRSLSITTGGTGSFTITASNACGRVDISSSNPGVATITSASSQWLENNSISISVKGVSAGTASITVRLSDAATFDEEELTGSYTVTVTVKDPASSAPAPTPSTQTQSTPKPSAPAPVVNNLSNNNKLSEISVEGYELTKKDENNYELLLTYDIDKIKINAKAEDKKAQIEGAGEKTVEIGENAFEIIVTSESKKQNKYKVNVTRKDAFYLEDLNYAIDKLEENVIDIKLRKDEMITKEHLQIVKESGKTVKFNYFDENNTNIYSWIIDGVKINTINDININVNFTSEYADNIEKVANYAKGIYLNLVQEMKLPEGTKLKIFVGNSYKDGDLLYIYSYDNVNFELNNIKNINVSNGYIEIEIKENAEYFISKAFIEKKIAEESGINILNILIIIIIIEAIIIITLLVLDYNNVNPISKIKNKKKEVKEKNKK